jgi:flavin-dependent dehydrogenase
MLGNGRLGARLKQGGKLTRLKAWPLPLGTVRGLIRVFNGALLTGDAASLVDPFSGEGIRNAVISGREAAAVLHQGLVGGDVTAACLQNYEERLWTEIRGVTRRSQVLKWMLEYTPWMVEGVARAARLNNPLLLRLFSTFSTDFTFPRVTCPV